MLSWLREGKRSSRGACAAAGELWAETRAGRSRAGARRANTSRKWTRVIEPPWSWVIPVCRILVRERKSVSKHRTHKGGEMFWNIGGSRPALRPDATGELFEQQNRKRRGDADNREANAEIPVDPAAGEQRDRSEERRVGKEC